MKAIKKIFLLNKNLKKIHEKLFLKIVSNQLRDTKILQAQNESHLSKCDGIQHKN